MLQICVTHILKPQLFTGNNSEHPKLFVNLLYSAKAPSSPHQLFCKCVSNIIYHIISVLLKLTPSIKSGMKIEETQLILSITLSFSQSIHHDLHKNTQMDTQPGKWWKQYTLAKFLSYQSQPWFHPDLALWSIYQSYIPSYFSDRYGTGGYLKLNSCCSCRKTDGWTDLDGQIHRYRQKGRQIKVRWGQEGLNIRQQTLFYIPELPCVFFLL